MAIRICQLKDIECHAVECEDGCTEENNSDDEFDSFTRSHDEDFHEWALQNDFIASDIDVYEACESAWLEAKQRCQSKLDKAMNIISQSTDIDYQWALNEIENSDSKQKES